MARPRSFDEGRAVQAAAEVFRRRGYTATSVDDLVSSTGVNRASLYSTFGSKHGLFLRALDATLSEPLTEASLDLYLVALIELAGQDGAARAALAEAIGRHGLTADLLGRRLLARAGLESESNQGGPS